MTHLHTDHAGGLHHFPDTENLPQWNSAVTGVRPTDRSTYLMTRDLPTGAVTNELHVVASEPPGSVCDRDDIGTERFHYEYTFSDDDDATSVELHARADIGPAPNLLGSLARRALASGIQANLRTLKHILENAQPGRAPPHHRR
jgi:Metallo-beta-lactamase superfamily